MCYVLLLSTTSDEDLTAHNNELVRFSKDLPTIADVSRLRYPCKWYVGSRSGCSCSFRHLSSVELGFGEPVDWYEEESDDIEATLQIISIVRALVANNEFVDCIDAWEHQDRLPRATNELGVELGVLSNREFRFFENHHFTFTISNPTIGGT
jgi:hypothetical protein